MVAGGVWCAGRSRGNRVLLAQVVTAAVTAAAENGRAAGFSAGSTLLRRPESSLQANPERELPDLTVSVIIKPGESEFLTPIPIEKIEVRHD